MYRLYYIEAMFPHDMRLDLSKREPRIKELAASKLKCCELVITYYIAQVIYFCEKGVIQIIGLSGTP